MRIYSFTKILSVLLLDFFLVTSVLGVEAGTITTLLILFYGWAGEYIALIKDGAIRLEHLNPYEKDKLIRVHQCLAGDVKRISNTDISNLKLHIVPSDEINAWAYGFHHISITRAALTSCDDTTLCAVLSHEVNHILCFDPVFHRIVFANVTLALLGLIAGSFISVSFLWILFFLLCAFGICGGLFSIFVVHGFTKIVKGFFSGLQHLIVFLYQVIMGLICRRCEFRADQYAVKLGYGPQLVYFLERFVDGQDSRQKTINELLYASHPATYKRIQKIDQHLKE